MPSTTLLSSLRRCAIAALLALGLIAAPLWVPALHLDDPTYEYERASVVIDESDGITYANESSPVVTERLSDDIGCLHSYFDYRLCAFERQLIGNTTVPSGWYTSNTDARIDSDWGQYRFVQLDGSTYQADTVVNESVTNENGRYRVDLTLEPVAPERVLDTVAVDPSADRSAVDPVVSEAAIEGAATSHRDIDVPATVLEPSEDSYYRVYQAGNSEPAPTGAALSALLFWGSPLVGIGILLLLTRYVDVRYSDRRSSWR